MSQEFRLNQLMLHANNILTALKKLDLPRVVEHDAPAVDYLHQALAVVESEVHRINDINRGVTRSDRPPEMPIPVAPPVSSVDATLNDDDEERKRMFVELLNDLGLGGKIGWVYSSLEDLGMISFQDLGNKRGLPAYDWVLAPESSPINCVRGIFVDDMFVFAADLHYPIADNEWQTSVKKVYGDPMEMLDWIKRFVGGEVS